MGWNDIENTNSNEKIPYTKFVEGNTIIRVLDKEPYSFWSHWMQNQQTSVTCLGRDCPICAVIAQSKANNTKVPFNNSHRHALRVWNYTTKQMEIMIQGRNFMQQLLSLHREVGDLTTYDVKVIRRGSGTDTTYTVVPTAPTEFNITEGITEINMEEQFKAPTREEILMLMEGKTWAEINGTAEAVA